MIIFISRVKVLCHGSLGCHSRASHPHMHTHRLPTPTRETASSPITAGTGRLLRHQHQLQHSHQHRFQVVHHAQQPNSASRSVSQSGSGLRCLSLCLSSLGSSLEAAQCTTGCAPATLVEGKHTPAAARRSTIHQVHPPSTRTTHQHMYQQAFHHQWDQHGRRPQSWAWGRDVRVVVVGVMCGSVRRCAGRHMHTTHMHTPGNWHGTHGT
jgi:hypothetical protein